ncbi:MAG: FtsX-like permease family protein [Candidatus Helarchaeota archaeon]|nr:FtsX-like permease family protein [Candidatus Helarchaeota archaeon]
MKLRIFIKSFKLALRTGKRFAIFVIVYMFLVVFTAYNLTNLFGPSVMVIQGPLDWLGIIEKNIGLQTFKPTLEVILLFLLVVIGTVIVSTFYGFIVSGYRKREVATLRTIGWDSGSIRTLFLGELLLVFLVAFLLVIEFIFHILGIMHYIFETTHIPGSQGLIIPGIVLVITFLIILGCQFLGTFVGHRRMLRVSPMDAMRKAV